MGFLGDILGGIGDAIGGIGDVIFKGFSGLLGGIFGGGGGGLLGNLFGGGEGGGGLLGNLFNKVGKPGEIGDASRNIDINPAEKRSFADRMASSENQFEKGIGRFLGGNTQAPPSQPGSMGTSAGQSTGQDRPVGKVENVNPAEHQPALVGNQATGGTGGNVSAVSDVRQPGANVSSQQGQSQVSEVVPPAQYNVDFNRPTGLQGNTQGVLQPRPVSQIEPAMTTNALQSEASSMVPFNPQGLPNQVVPQMQPSSMAPTYQLNQPPGQNQGFLQNFMKGAQEINPNALQNAPALVELNKPLYNKLLNTFPRGNPDIIKNVASHTDILKDYGIDSPQRMRHFLAQVGHESAGFKTTQEYASGRAYENRKDLGNVNPGDGTKYKGRGLIQITGRANYQKYGKKLNLDLVNKPELAEDPVNSLKIAGEYWKDHDLNKFADQDNIRAITRRINGGYNGLRDRQALYNSLEGVGKLVY